MANDDLPYPAWQKALQDAVVEFRPDKAAQKISDARRLIATRLKELVHSGNSDEQDALVQALRLLRNHEQSCEYRAKERVLRTTDTEIPD